MPEPADQPAATRPPRTWRPMALWSAVLVLVLGVAWAVTVVVASVWQVRDVLEHYPGEAGGELCPMDLAQVRADIGRLGGGGAAARKIRLYLRMPRALADRKQVAVLMLPACEVGADTVVPIVTALTRDSQEDVRSSARKALEELRGIEARKLMLDQVVGLLRESGYWRDYPLRSVKYDAERRQWAFLFSDGRSDAGYAAYIADGTSERIDILLFPPMWTKYERRNPAAR